MIGGKHPDPEISAYYRFEIEEFFRDGKRLLGLEHINFKRKRGLAVILQFVIPGIWFLWTLKETEFDKIQLEGSEFFSTMANVFNMLWAISIKQ